MSKRLTKTTAILGSMLFAANGYVALEHILDSTGTKAAVVQETLSRSQEPIEQTYQSARDAANEVPFPYGGLINAVAAGFLGGIAIYHFDERNVKE